MAGGFGMGEVVFIDYWTRSAEEEILVVAVSAHTDWDHDVFRAER
jgi:hypothetical protein